MSVVAWDGRYLVTDRRASSVGLNMITCKSKRIDDNTVAAWVGERAYGLALCAWYEAGADIAKYPDFQKDPDNWTVFIVVKNGECFYYERTPYPQPVLDEFFAWGSGRDYAVAAMHLGQTAMEAVALASKLEINCGNGFDAHDCDPFSNAVLHSIS